MEGSLIEESGLLSEEQAAKKLLVSRRTLQRMCREGEIQFVQLQPRVRGFRPEHIEEYIRRKTVTPPKLVDRSAIKSLPFPWKGGDERKSTGDTLSERKRMKEELRSCR